MILPNSEDAWKRCCDAILAIDEKNLVYCDVLPEVATSEATALAIAATEDREALIGAGIDPVFVDSLPERAVAFAVAAAEARMAPDAVSEFERRWQNTLAEGYRVRSELLRQLRHAFRNDTSVLSGLSGIMERHRHQDMVVDLLALHIICTEHQGTLMRQPDFDTDTAKAALSLHTALNELMARARIRPKTLQRAQSTFHKAWTYYKLAADEVKIHGQFLFEGTGRFRLYVSNWCSNPEGHPHNGKTASIEDALLGIAAKEKESEDAVSYRKIDPK